MGEEWKKAFNDKLIAKQVGGVEKLVGSGGLDSLNLPDSVAAETSTEADIEEFLKQEEPASDTSDEPDDPPVNTEAIIDAASLSTEPSQSASDASNDNVLPSTSTAHGRAKRKAVKMIKMSERKFQPLPVGSNVTIPFPDVDRAKGDARNTIAVVLEVSEDQLHTFGTQHGRLAALYMRNQFRPCKEEFLKASDVPDAVISLRSLSRADSNFGGQGFTKCSCRGQCNDTRCSCKKKGLQCNSKCHNSGPCCNK
ncbi:unnamed protein product [Bemisia tabaci]|uniref:Uncharacterized protein n=1 Tax=Bemisia tabaci TaxID=7038 RepID=A0A9P0EZT8_BEMTA|nr:unnamed protein product [Bemisia tabaci]